MRLAVALILIIATGITTIHTRQHLRPAVVSAPPPDTSLSPGLRASRGMERLPLPGRVKAVARSAKARHDPVLSGERDLRGPATVEHLHWPALAHCESTNNPRAVDPSGTYFGLYQFDLTTWASVGGHGNPADATPAEQTYRAQLLYARRGRAPWPVCGRWL